jgi:cytochrome P450
MMRDDNVYENPGAFIPERFLEPLSPEEERRRDPKNFVFGFGRRYAIPILWS